MKSNISSDMNKPCWKLVKACPQSQKLFCFRENNLPVGRSLPEPVVQSQETLQSWHHTPEPLPIVQPTSTCITQPIGPKIEHRPAPP